MHTITKSQVVGKALRDLSKDVSIKVQTTDKHAEWTKTTTGVIDFLSRCTLRYANSHGATYKIDPTYNLRIISNKNRHFYLDSYEKLLDLVIEDYQELRLQEQPMSDTPKYLDRDFQDGDYAERINNAIEYMPLGWIARVVGNGKAANFIDQRGKQRNLYPSNFKIINPDHPSHPNYQEPKLEIKPGTHWERLKEQTANKPKGQIIVVKKVTDTLVKWTHPDSGDANRDIENFLEHFKPRPDLDTPSIPLTEPTVRRGLAFYKESGKSWTRDEYLTISKYCGDSPTPSQLRRFENSNDNKYVYDDGDTGNFMYSWSDEDPEWNPQNYTIHSYESIFCTPKPKSTKTIKPKSVAQPEPIIPTPIKETFMSKIKASASATVDQNKQALVIASKMEAGRIINKQVLKQLTPHLPFFLQGYAKSPFAPFVAANLVAMVANHTGNSKLTKVSDLMLLGAADSGVAAFNLDKIVDDILSNIKLPAGVLDDSDDE